MIKRILRKKKPVEKLPSRITNDTVAEHREKVLAGGRKLKYPLQYTRYKLVRNTIVISLVALAALVALVWAQLYVWKDTSDLAYRITQAIPLPVAKIDGKYVRYSDYLLYHRSTMAFLEDQGGSEDQAAADKIKFHKQQALDRALEGAYVQKIASEKGLSVSDEQVKELVESERSNRGLTPEAYEAAVSDRLKWTMDEVHRAFRIALLRREVAFNIDTKAADLAQEINTALLAGGTLQELAEKYGKRVEYRAEIMVPADNSDGGLSEAVSNLAVGEVSGSIKTMAGDGYYFAMRQESGEGEIRYSYLKVPLEVFQEKFKAAKDSDQTKIYIDLE